MSLTYYYALLSEKQYQLQRLQTCSNQLHIYQQELIGYEKKLTQPGLSSHTWQGVLANKFDQTRHEQMQTKYLELDAQQFDAVYKAISDKTSSLQSEISTIKQTIQSLEEALAAEKEKEKARAK